MITLIEQRKLPSRRPSGAKRIILPERDYIKNQRIAESFIKKYLTFIIRNAQRFVLSSANNYERLSEAIEFPSREQVAKRWEKVKGSLNVKKPHMWDPNKIPLSFLDYRQDILNAAAEEKFIGEMAGISASSYIKATTSAAKQMGVPPIYNPSALEAIREHTFKIVTTDINETIANQLIKKIETSIKQGMTIEETARNLGVLNTNWRSIARTEVMGAVNQGAMDLVRQETQETGLQTLKGWLHSGNSNGRIEHIKAGVDYGPGNEIPFDQPFIVGGEQMQHPHDASASADNVVNCGCTTFITVPEGAI